VKRLAYLTPLIFLCFLFSSCVTLRLEKQLKKLNPAIAEWYSYHSILMETKIPKWIDERGGGEKVHFLRLPQKLQVAYVTIFWKIRTEGAREEYYNRIAAANRSFSGEGKPGWRTDRGRVLLLCGFPTYVTHYPIINRGGKGSDVEGHRYEIWEYYQRGYLIQYAFKYHTPNSWRREFFSLMDGGAKNNFEKRCRELFAPTEDGWDLWGSILLQWVKENEIL